MPCSALARGLRQIRWPLCSSLYSQVIVVFLKPALKGETCGIRSQTGTISRAFMLPFILYVSFSSLISH